MHESIIEHVAYERGKEHLMDGYDTGWADGYRAKKSGDIDSMCKNMDNIQEQLEELLYLVGDRPTPATEDEIMNYIIGMIESVKIKKMRLKT